jgi:hypothetical protein
MRPAPAGCGRRCARRWSFGPSGRDRALAAATSLADPAEAARAKLDVALHQLRRGREDEARPLLLAVADALPPLVRPRGDAEPGALNAPVWLRIELVYALSWVGEGERAAAVARAFPSAGWRAWGLSLVVSQLPGDGGPRGGRDLVIALSPSDVPVFD